MQNNTVKILAVDVANKIAAGEVVERPASVVKELVENALDAEAKRITVEISGGGRSRIRVSDDGTGMSRSDALLAVQRHATSKIRTAKDIDAITTLGFRGEALPSIAAVSHFELHTSTRETGEGTRVRIDGGAAPDCVESARSAGTTVNVSNLFYCVPARAKFLKTTATELSHIGRFMYGMALAWPRKGFKYVVDGTEHFDVPPQPEETPFLTALRTRLVHLRGDAFTDDLIPITYTEDTCAVEGYISSWSRTVMTRNELYLYVNQRPVRCSWYGSLLKRAYGTLLSSERYPYAFLFLRTQAGSVDVNIHPSKREVRFANEFKVQSVISRGVMNALQEKSKAPSVTLAPPRETGIRTAGEPDRGETRVRQPEKPRDPWQTKLTVEEWKRLYGTEPAEKGQIAEQAGAVEEGREKSMTGAAAEVPAGPAAADAIRAIGQAGEAYIVAEITGVRNGLVLVDQHAAHERVNYDLVVHALESEQAPQQALLMPVTVHVSGAQAAVIAEQLSALRAAGFGIEEFGVDTFKIDGVPGYLDDTNLDNMLVDIADEFLAHGSSSRIEDIRRRLALVLVCRGSVKFNQALSQREMQALLDQLLATETPWTCPHGRPTMIVLPYAELEKRFGRRK